MPSLIAKMSAALALVSLAACGRTSAAWWQCLAEERVASDIIWVVDESGTMDDLRGAVSRSAARLFQRLNDDGVDFRMGVTSMADDGEGAGRFCSTAAINPHDWGGDDRFLGRQESELFAQCISNPPGYNLGFEYGLHNARQAIVRHLPRAVNAADRLRPDAVAQIVILTNEASQDIQRVLGADPREDLEGECTLPLDVQAEVDTLVRGYASYLSDARVVVHVFAITCSSTCLGARGHGYEQLTGGRMFDVCRLAEPDYIDALADHLAESTCVEGRWVPW